ncbi:MAG TPA: hypothetical protein VI955_01370, partial [Candidatus Omnitrophota bacterium]|nr:hypothetical protein [Candidatus Omnitrophota bacterium]
MNKVIIALGFLAGIFFGLQAAGIPARVKRDTIEVEKLKKDMTHMKSLIERMKTFTDDDLVSLEQ